MRGFLLIAVLLAPTVAHAEEYDNTAFVNTAFVNTAFVNTAFVNTAFVNGGTVDGITLGKMKHENGHDIDAVVIEKDYLKGSTYIWEYDHWGINGPVFDWHYKPISKAQFEGATFEATVSEVGGVAALGKVTLRITDTRTTLDANNETRYQHVIDYFDTTTNSYKPVCGCENGVSPCTPVPATLVQGAWNYTEGTANGGKKISNDPNHVTIACANAAIAKCAADQSVRGPSTATYTSHTTVTAAAWVYKPAQPVFPGTTLTVSTTGGYGNTDLYLRWNSNPTSAAYHCRRITASSNESCEIVVTAGAKTVHVALYGASGGGATVNISSTSLPRGMGYTPWRTYACGRGGVCTPSGSTQLQTCTRMVTADYCGDGSSHTITGRPIDVHDTYGEVINQPTIEETELAYWEAEWTPYGAKWVFTCRYDQLQLSPENWAECPVYNGQQHDVILMNPIYSGGQIVGCQNDQSQFTFDSLNVIYNKNDGGTLYGPQ